MMALRVNVFPGGFNWAIFVGIELQFFAREGVEITLQPTTGSVAQMTSLAAGDCDIAMTAFDNVVAYVEGQGEAPIGPQPEFVAFLGSDDSFLSLVGRRELAQIADLRDGVLSVDAATTGYAFVLFDMLESAGVMPGDYTVRRAGGMTQRFDDLCAGGAAATMLSTPYDLLAERAGLRVIARNPAPYQGNVAAARRNWAESNRGALTGYSRAYVAALRWLHNPTNEQTACEILQRNAPRTTSQLAAASYRRMCGPDGGFSSDGRLNEQGVRRVLALRSRYTNRSLALTAGKYSTTDYLDFADARP